MVNFFAIGAKISSRPVHDLVVEKVNGHEHYRLSTELDLKKLPAGSKIVQAIEFDSIPDIKTGFLGKQAIIKIPGQLDLLLESILDYDPETECFKSYYNTQDIKCDSDVVVILRRGKINTFK